MRDSISDLKTLTNIKIDARGRGCPIPIVQLARGIETARPGDIVEVMATDHAFPKDVEAWCKQTGHVLLSCNRNGECYVALVKKKS